jgi:hypothetical protein
LNASTIHLTPGVQEHTRERGFKDMFDATMAMPKNKGIFMNEAYGSVSGVAGQYNPERNLVLTLKNMNISNGNQFYNVSASPDFWQYKNALVH